MRIIASIVTGLGVLALTGCASLTSPARMHELDPNQAYWFDYISDRRGTLLIPKAAGVITCAEPSPDTAMNFVSKLGLQAELPQGQGSAEISSDVQQEVVQLAKRTQLVMFLRESLFRLCEISTNNGLTSDQVVAQYQRVIEAALALAKVEAANAQEKAAEAELKLLKFRKDTAAAIDKVE